jgi:hypothetical protein
MATELVRKTAHANVVNDAVLSGEVASTVCGSLGLASTNMTMGRKIVSLAMSALDAHPNLDGLDAFADQANQFGTLSKGILRDIYIKVQLFGTGCAVMTPHRSRITLSFGSHYSLF